MEKILEQIGAALEEAFERAGYEKTYGKAALSNRPDLCEYQCNGAMAAARAYKKAPILIAQDVAKALEGKEMFAQVCAAPPGFLNLTLNREYLASYLNSLWKDEALGCKKIGAEKRIVLDYGGPNVAKPLHVGHLRSAIIGESLKRIARYLGYDVIGDVHLGDWGLQMGLIIEELRQRQPSLPYFDPDFTGEYPKEAPFTISQLEEIYPCASAKAKADPDFSAKAHEATYKLQKGDRGYRALWRHIMDISVADLKKNYEKLHVEFDVWKGESDAQPYIPPMVQKMKAEGFAYESDGALVVDVKEEGDAKEVPPCILVKSDGATLYSTTDLATLVEREKEFSPDMVLYVVDKRQEMHFKQVFRCAKKTGIVRPGVELKFLGFGTMNGKDGKPFKTREGGVMRLETLIRDINQAVYEKMCQSSEMEEKEAEKIAPVVGLSALKYGDLSNQASKDYVFDVDRFSSFEGDTGPYILYTIVRIKSILAKYKEQGGNWEEKIKPANTDGEKGLQLCLTKCSDCIETAFGETAPHKICQYVYELSNLFNKFYHETKILAEPDSGKQAGYIALLVLTKKVLETCIDLLGFEAPDRM